MFGFVGKRFLYKFLALFIFGQKLKSQVCLILSLSGTARKVLCLKIEDRQDSLFVVGERLLQLPILFLQIWSFSWCFENHPLTSQIQSVVFDYRLSWVSLINSTASAASQQSPPLYQLLSHQQLLWPQTAATSFCYFPLSFQSSFYHNNFTGCKTSLKLSFSFFPKFLQKCVNLE